MSCCAGPQNTAEGIRTAAEARERLASDAPEDVLLALLGETHPVWSGLGGPQVVKLRVELLTALGAGSPSDAALPFLLEELESAHDARLTAVAAAALRRGARRAEHVPPLLAALTYINGRDERIELGVLGAPDPPAMTTATEEVLRTLGWLGDVAASALPHLRVLQGAGSGPRVATAAAAAQREIEKALVGTAARPCCEPPAAIAATPAGRAAPPPLELGLEDQAGNRIRFADYFLGRPTIVVFFYTRCENSAKCPRTISRLGVLQQRLMERGLGEAVQTAAITYDPDYDLPDRLEQYARSYGAQTAPHHRFLRTVADHEVLREWFDLGVGYGPSLVNRHRLEAYVLDVEGRIQWTVARRRWDADDLIARALELRG